jgi:hypothetical protein
MGAVGEKSPTNAEPVQAAIRYNKIDDALIAVADPAKSKPDDSQGHIADRQQAVHRRVPTNFGIRLRAVARCWRLSDSSCRQWSLDGFQHGRPFHFQKRQFATVRCSRSNAYCEDLSCRNAPHGHRRAAPIWHTRYRHARVGHTQPMSNNPTPVP